MDQNSFIQAIDIRKVFPVEDMQVEALKGISLKIGKGDFCIIFGPSGCGKSTLLHTLLGLEVPTSGKIYLDGKDIYSMDEDQRALHRRRTIGMIYQQPLWVGSLNVIENIMFPLHLLNLPEEDIQKKAYQTLEMVGLTSWAMYAPTQLSSGQQQKISLARAMMTEPQLIVADEPTGNLDTVSGQDLMNTFISLIKDGKSIIMVTHDLEYLKYGTKIVHMIDGSVVEEYKPQQKNKLSQFQGKKHIGSDGGIANVHDPKLLEKLQL